MEGVDAWEGVEDGWGSRQVKRWLIKRAQSRVRFDGWRRCLVKRWVIKRAQSRVWFDGCRRCLVKRWVIKRAQSRAWFHGWPRRLGRSGGWVVFKTGEEMGDKMSTELSAVQWML